ncbi:uncharacterized protein LOC134062350 isoform X2 [Sardina pilchardus]|uniref:uncharacterized protein LOC134062350 isoform X2 n=1 Tax=Sardina pilchardus TaxID=27697 RepID=UPI002E0FFDC5
MFSSFSKFILQVDVELSCVVLVVVEKLIEKEFNCPCNSSNNFFFCGLVASSGFIIIGLTVLIQVHHYKKLLIKKKEENKDQAVRQKEKEEKRTIPIFQYPCIIVLSGLISIFAWLTLWFAEGHYYLCLQSSLDGVWAQSNSKGTPNKWCEPYHINSIQRKEQIIKSTEQFNDSQEQQTERNAENMPLNQQQSSNVCQQEKQTMTSEELLETTSNQTVPNDPPASSATQVSQATGGMQPDGDGAETDVHLDRTSKCPNANTYPLKKNIKQKQMITLLLTPNGHHHPSPPHWLPLGPALWHSCAGADGSLGNVWSLVVYILGNLPIAICCHTYGIFRNNILI